MHTKSTTTMKKSHFLLTLLAGLLLIAGTSCTVATGNGCLHIDSNIENLDQHSGPSVCALCTPQIDFQDDLQNELQKQFAWTQLD